MHQTPPGFVPLSDAEVDRLQDMFARQTAPSALNAEEMDGFFTALLIGPEMVPPREYLSIVLGELDGGGTDTEPGADAAFAHLDELDEFLSLVMRHWNTIAGAVQRDEIYLPLIFEREPDDLPGPPDGHRWARGFMRGVNMRRKNWTGLIQDEEWGGAIIPVALLSGELDPDFLQRPVDVAKHTELLSLMIAGVHQIQKYYAPLRRANAALEANEVSAQPGPFRRGAAKVSRNEPCPCGSGRKFKQCCGRGDAR